MRLHNELQRQGRLHALSWEEKESGPSHNVVWTAIAFSAFTALLHLDQSTVFLTVHVRSQWSWIRTWQCTKETSRSGWGCEKGIGNPPRRAFWAGHGAFICYLGLVRRAAHTQKYRRNADHQEAEIEVSESITCVSIPGRKAVSTIGTAWLFIEHEIQFCLWHVGNGDSLEYVYR